MPFDDFLISINSLNVQQRKIFDDFVERILQRFILLDIMRMDEEEDDLCTPHKLFNLFSMCTLPSTTTTQTKMETGSRWIECPPSSTSFFSGWWSYSYLIYVCCFYAFFPILLKLYWFCDLLQIIVIVHSYRPSDVLCNKLYCLNLIL